MPTGDRSWQYELYASSRLPCFTKFFQYGLHKPGTFATQDNNLRITIKMESLIYSFRCLMNSFASIFPSLPLHRVHAPSCLCIFGLHLKISISVGYFSSHS